MLFWTLLCVRGVLPLGKAAIYNAIHVAESQRLPMEGLCNPPPPSPQRLVSGKLHRPGGAIRTRQEDSERP